MSLFHAAMSPSLPACFHRGFDLDVQSRGTGFAFTVTHDGLALHVSDPAHRTALSAERAARQFVDDALGVFEQETPAYAL